MSIHKKIVEDAKQAMIDKDEPRLTVLKGVKAAFMNELLAKKGKPQEELGDEEATTLLRRLVKQRKDSIDMFTEGGRKDLVANEKAELKVLEEYLPALMSEEDVIRAIKKIKNGLDDSVKNKNAALMSAVMKELKGKADGALVKRMVDALLNEK